VPTYGRPRSDDARPGRSSCPRSLPPAPPTRPPLQTPPHVAVGYERAYRLSGDTFPASTPPLSPALRRRGQVARSGRIDPRQGLADLERPRECGPRLGASTWPSLPLARRLPLALVATVRPCPWLPGQPVRSPSPPCSASCSSSASHLPGGSISSARSAVSFLLCPVVLSPATPGPPVEPARSPPTPPGSRRASRHQAPPRPLPHGHRLLIAGQRQRDPVRWEPDVAIATAECTSCFPSPRRLRQRAAHLRPAPAWSRGTQRYQPLKASSSGRRHHATEESTWATGCCTSSPAPSCRAGRWARSAQFGVEAVSLVVQYRHRRALANAGTDGLHRRLGRRRTNEDPRVMTSPKSAPASTLTRCAAVPSRPAR